MRVFRLYGFTDGKSIVVTRGETMEQAMSYAARKDGCFDRGVTVQPLDYLPINASQLYSSNHNYGWLYRKPRWLQVAEREEAKNYTIEQLMEIIARGETLPVLMYKN